jgi:hypothetical protein
MEVLSYFAGVIGTLLALMSGMLVWRKNLLNSGFEKFRELYRVEMDDFKTTVRGFINSNEQEHRKTYNRIVELFEQTHKEVTSQTTICKIIQTRREGSTKIDDLWKDHIKKELDEVREDVRRIKKVINHADIN